MTKMLEIGIAAGLSALIIGVGHWFPWRGLLHRDLRRTEAYIYGVCAILLPVLTVLSQRGDWYAIWLTLACVAAAGAMTIGAKAIDAVLEYRNELHDRRVRDAKARAVDTQD